MPKATSKPGWKDGFLFVGNQLALDFVNTRPVQDGRAAELIGDFAALVRWFRAAGLLSPADAGRLERQWGATAQAKKTAEEIRELRERLRSEISGWEKGGAIKRVTVQELNRLMAEHPMRTKLTARGRAHAKELWFEAREPKDLFAPVAHSAVGLFADLNRERVRKCAECVLHFHDTSKKGTRRWCSMRLCGNRKKVAAYAARHRERR